MTPKTFKSSNPDITNSLKAIRRAARAARKLSIETKIPFYVMKNGKIVDLNRPAKTKPPRR
jgi:hypothetical protein